MRFVVTIMIWLINHLWVVALFIVLAYFLLARYQRKAIRRQPHDPKLPAALLLLLLPLLFVFSFFSRYVTIPLIYSFGEETIGKVVSSDSIPVLHNEQQVYRHEVVFYDTNNELIETSFDTNDFNIYPLSNRAVYPGEGQSFTLRYMKNMPEEFIIVENK